MSYVLDRQAAVEMIEGAKSIFTVEFKKRSTGELRKMNCRRGVKKHLRGGAPAYSFAKKNLVPVYDLQKEGYRSISVEGITRLRIDKKEFEVADLSLRQDENGYFWVTNDCRVSASFHTPEEAQCLMSRGEVEFHAV